MSSYIYQKSSTASGNINEGELIKEIKALSLNTPLKNIMLLGLLEFVLIFEQNLDLNSENSVNNAISNHNGQPEYSPDQTVSIYEFNHKTDALKIPLVAIVQDEGDFTTQISHNFCDKNTWAISTSDSAWTMAPTSGYNMFVNKSELQFTHDISMGSPADREVYLKYYGWHPGHENPILFQTITFDSLYSIFEYGNNHSTAPSIGTEIPYSLTTVHFNYVKNLAFYSSFNAGKLAYLEVSTKDHLEIGGTYCTASFVTSEKDEN